MTPQTRVRIDPSTGLLEVEGSETFVREMLDKYSGLLNLAEQVIPDQSWH